MPTQNICLLAVLFAGLLLPMSAKCANEPSKREPAAMVSPAARPLIEKAIQAAGGKSNLLGFFAFKDHVRLGEIAIGLMYCLTEDKGLVALAEASPNGWKELSRSTPAPQSNNRALKGKVWAPPVIAHGRLYLRDQEKLWCYQISLEAAPSKDTIPRQP